jgi:hypothetical protein
MSEFQYERWRHGGWYITNIRYPSGAVGCVAWDYDQTSGKRTGRFRIACDSRKGDYTYPTRDAAARAERELAEGR